jgi:hypothetical protein
MKVDKVDSYNLNDVNSHERIYVDNRRYVENLKKHAMEERKKNSPILFEDTWPSFSDYKDVELKRLAYNLIEDLYVLDVRLKGVAVEKNEFGTIVEPKFVVYLPKEYRGETSLIEEMFPKEVIAKGGYKKIEITYRIFN